jgi:hypothetical protein
MTMKAGHLRTLAAPWTESEVTDREFVERYVRRPDDTASLRWYGEQAAAATRGRTPT